VPRPLVYIHHGSSHHAAHSGYARLIDYSEGETISGVHSVVPYRLRKFVAQYVDQSFGIYDSSSLGKEIKLSVRMLKTQNGIAHFLNGERDVRFTTRLKKPLGWNFVGSFHEPPYVIKECITRDRYMKKLDGAIAVGRNQLEILSKMVGGRAIAYIPHGVDTDFFRPGNFGWGAYNALFVGQHLRDFETLGSTIEILSKRIPQFQLNAVIVEGFSRFLPKRENVKILYRVTDEQLLGLYQNSSVLLLPLLEVTACNAILEALASGLPVITTRLTGNETYLDDTSAFLVNAGDASGLADAVYELMSDEALNKKMRKISRDRSLAFSWPKISEMMMSYYKTNFGY
jgi:glycosyltransferase involved in cell wall biosynthesis